MRSVHFYILMLYCSWTAIAMQAQEITYSVEHFSIDDGLPSNRVHSLLVHSSGYIWVGTNEGLRRFDGYKFQAIEVTRKKTPGSSQNKPGKTKDPVALIDKGSIYGLRELKSGNMILYAQETSFRDPVISAILFNPAEETVEVISDDTSQYVVNFTDFLNDPLERSLMVGSTDSIHQLLFCDKFRNEFKIEYKIPSRAVLSAVLHLNTGEQVDLSPLWSTIYGPQSPNANNLGKVIYVGGANGLFKVAIHKSLFQKIFWNELVTDWEFGNRCRSMIQVNKDTILMSVEDQGLYIYNLATNQVSLPGRTMSRDNNTAGIYRYFRHLEKGGNDNTIYGARLGGLMQYDVENDLVSMKNSISYYPMSASPIMKTKYLVSSGTKPTEYLFELFDLRTGEVGKIDFGPADEFLTMARPTFMLPDSDSTLFHATKSGLFYLDIKHQKVLHAYLDRNAPRKAYPFPVTYNLSGPHVWRVYLANDHKLWAAMDADGITTIDLKSGRTTYLSTDDGLSNNTVVGILPDAGGYWFSTFNGLSYYDTTSSVFHNFYTADGISHNEFNRFASLIDSSGRYYFGSMNGITAFYPDEVLPKQDTARLLISEILYYQQGDLLLSRTNYTDQPYEIIVPSRNRTMAIHLTMTELSDPAGNTFYYQLIPGRRPSPDEPWVPIQNHILRFDNLEAGDYALVLRGLSSKGILSNIVSVPIHVSEYFYRTWWFMCLVLCMVVSLVYLFYRMRLAQALRMERLRTRLSSDLHDDVGGLLSGVAFQMEALEHVVDQQHRSQVMRIAQSSRKAMERMRDTVWAIDARRQTLGDLKDRMLETAEEILSPLDIGCSIHTDPALTNLVLPSLAKHNLLLIYKEFIHNTVKHAEASHVDIRINKKGRDLQMTLLDNGIGLNANVGHSTGQGLKNMEMRAKKMNGTIRFLREKGFGVVVDVHV